MESGNSREVGGLTSSFNSQVSEQTLAANTRFDSQGVACVAIWWACKLTVHCIFTRTWSLHHVTKVGTLYLVLFLPVHVEDYQSSERASFLKVFHIGAQRGIEQSQSCVIEYSGAGWE